MTKDYLERQFKNYYEITCNAVTPQMFGAKGDGVTDDTEAIQAAFDAVNTASGGVVYFSKGTYKVIPTTTLQVYSNTTILGDRGESIIAVDPEFQLSAVLINIGTSSRSVTNVHIRGITFRGVENYGSAQSGLRLIEAWQATNISFTDCLFQNNMNGAIKLVKSSNIQVFDSRFEAVDCGVIAQGNGPVNDVTIRGCHFTGISSLNSFTNFNSESISLFCSEANTEPCRRWRIEDCIFEHKATCGVLIGVQGGVTGGGHIACKDIIVRNCTFGGILAAVTVTEAEDVLLDGLFFDDTPKIMTDHNIHTLLHFKGSRNCIVKNVVSRCTQFVFTLIRFGDTYNSNITIDGFDAVVPYNESNHTISVLFASNSDSSIKNNNITIKNAILHDNAKNVNRATYIQYSNLENSYIDITPASNETLILSNYLPSAYIGTVTNNKIIVNTLADVRRNWSSSKSVADGNEWILIGNGIDNTSALPNSINQSIMFKVYNIIIPNKANYDASLEITDFYLMNEGYEIYINFVASSYTAGKTFTFAKTGNIIPIDEPFTFSNDYKVVCHFVQKNAKWVEVERTLEYYEGANVDANANVAFIRDKNLLQLPDGDFSINNVNLSIKDNIITLNSTNVTTNRIFIKLTNGIALNEGSAPTSWRSETVDFMEAGKTYGIRDFSFGGTANDTGMAASVRDSSGTSILSRSRTNPVQISASPAYIQLYIESNSSFVDYKVGVAITENEIPQDWGDIVACKDYWKQYISQCFLDTVNFINIGPVTGYVTQGMCTDGTYLYTCLVDSGSDSSNTYVYKYNLADGTLVASVNSYSLGHCNSMTCIPGGHIACVALDNEGTVHIINSSDLSYATSFTVDLSDVYSAYTGIGAISYNASRDVFVCLIRGSRRGYAVLDRNLNLLDLVWTRNFYVDPRTAVIYGSCFADDNFIYQVTYNYNGVQVFTYNGDYVGNIILPSAMYANELEDIIIDGENVYINIQQSNAPHIAKLAIHDKRYACVLKR